MSKKSARDARSVVYFEIGSGSVAAACGVVHDDVLTLHWSRRLYRPLDDVHNADQFKKIMLSSFMDLAMTLAAEGIPTAKREAGFDPKHASCHVFLAAPWYVATTRTASKEKEIPFRITENLVREFVERDLESVSQAVAASNKNPLIQNPQSLETLTLAARLNGYPVHHYLGKECTTLLLTTYYSMLAQQIQDNIVEVVTRVLPNCAHQLHSTALVHYQTLRTVDPYARNTALVEIGAEITNVSSIRDGVLTQCMSFATGTNHFLRHIAHKNAGRDEAVSKAEQLLTKANGEDTETVDSSLMEAIHVWRTGLIETMNTLAQGEPRPRTLALVVNDPWPKALVESLGTYWQHETLGAIEPMRVVSLNESLHGVHAKSNSSRTDTRLLLLGHSLAQLRHVYRTSAL